MREAARTSEPLLSKRDQPAVGSAFNVLRRSLQSSVDKLQEIIGIAIESMDVEIARLGVKTHPDAATQVVSERLRDILGRTE